MLAPHAETSGAGDPLFPPEVDQLVEYRTCQLCLQPVADQYIWPGRGGGGIRDDSERMRTIGGHNFVHIGSEAQHLPLARARHIELYRRERRVIDADPGALRGRYQPIGAVRLAPQHRGEKPRQAQARDWRTLIEPATIRGDAHADLAEIPRRRPAAPSIPSGGLARQPTQRFRNRFLRHRRARPFLDLG